METSSAADAPPVMSFRKTKRMESKKRKTEAFLELVAKEAVCNPSVISKKFVLGTKTTKNLDKDAKSLMGMRKNLKNIGSKAPPVFSLTECGSKAQVNLSSVREDNPPEPVVSPLFVEDIQYLLIKALLSGITACDTRWCKLYTTKNISRVLLLVIDGLSKDCIVRNVSHLKNMVAIFPDTVEVVTPNSYSLNFATELSTVHLTLGHMLSEKEQHLSQMPSNAHKPLSTLFPISSVCNMDTSEKSYFYNIYSKLHLLLSPIQLVMENYPLPKSVFEGSKSDGYCFTKSEYTPVTEESPIYALDCEMCQTKVGRMEVTRIAIVDEKYDVIYSTLVKPEGEVANYLTNFSGVTQSMLKSVRTRLSDVQFQIASLLPSDAILCGQSLNCDLHALRMIHPYVIDTSIIYNLSGIRTRKTGLKILSQYFLNEVIQDDQNGHNPIEDCIATMKLVQLKLEKGPHFGDTILSSCQEPKKSAKKEIISLSIFSQLQEARKMVCIIANEQTLQSYCEITDNVKKVAKQNMRKVIKHTVNAILNYNLTISHINLLSKDLSPDILVEIDDYVKQLYNTCDAKTLFIAFASGLRSKNEKNKYENGLCMIKVKEHKRN